MEEKETFCSHIYGYCIAGEFIFQIQHSTVFSLAKKPGKVTYLPCIKLRGVMPTLLAHMLFNARQGMISDDELIRSVWDRNGLKGSSRGLWHTVASLKGKLKEIGLDQEFIYRVNGEGYMVRESLITTLYLNRLEMLPGDLKM